MKKILILLFLILNSLVLYSQDTIVKADEIPYIELENIKVAEGCNNKVNKDDINCFDQKLGQHIKKNFRYPEKALIRDIEGEVIVNFIIDKDGYVKEITTSKANPHLQNEALRIIKLLPKFNPISKDGKPIIVRCSVPIKFKLL